MSEPERIFRVFSLIGGTCYFVLISVFMPVHAFPCTRGRIGPLFLSVTINYCKTIFCKKNNVHSLSLLPQLFPF